MIIIFLLLLFKILKEISKDKLVVVVSHDVKRAKAYCDYCIELEDGEIINCDCSNEEEKNKTPIDVKKRNPKLSLDLLYKLSRWNVSRSNLKPIFNIAIIALIMSMLYLLLPLAFYDYPLALSKNLKKAELPLVIINTAASEDAYNMDPLSDIDDKWGLKSYPTVYGIMNNMYTYYSENGLYHNNGVCVYNIKRRVTQYDEAFGIDFVYGRAPEQDCEIAISLTEAYNIVSMKGIYNQDKEVVEVENIDELIGNIFL